MARSCAGRIPGSLALVKLPFWAVVAEMAGVGLLVWSVEPWPGALGLFWH